MTMVKYSDNSDRVVKLSRKDRLEIERTQEKILQKEKMHDVQLILGNLFAREEATVKLILDCLYDVGSVNLINKKVPRPLNRFMKAIASMSKPAFRMYMLHWFNKNCPQLIADWLESKVSDFK